MKTLFVSCLLLLLPTVAMAAVQECSIDMAKTAPNVRYDFNDNGTITDRKTGLTWMRCPIGKTWSSTNQTCEGDGTGMFWQSALNEVQSINQSTSHNLYQFAGKSTWRLPNIKELVSLAEHSCRKPALNGKAFNEAFPYQTTDGDVRAYVWSNTLVAEASEILVFDVRNAEVGSYGVSALEASVLLVSED
ncbi:DUF1566 domain-containing protein [Vibrio sp. SCSIO 43135]|uniref:Lcl C-terminal domain-containing protein n=1 Tax=Vibrio sp. SCSIO 43135 TaxID=2819096 RepID=UPI002075EF75|nr:DUF1566 domain-containing protein [Vibrio sp. SCSIO 43135]USD42878.1 DUF1566 domain-containing protein [Vibrio sp. SCSIO 43135]